MLSDTWHILHFVGRGNYDTIRQEGVLALVGPDGGADLIGAGRLPDLLCGAESTSGWSSLNSCSSGEAGVGGLFSGTAAALVQRGFGAVAAIQYSITDGATIRFAHRFYTDIAHGRPSDEPCAAAGSGSWGAPAPWNGSARLYMEPDSSQLFRHGMPSPAARGRNHRTHRGPVPAHRGRCSRGTNMTTVTAADAGTALDAGTAPGTGTSRDRHQPAPPLRQADSRVERRPPRRPRPRAGGAGC